MKRLSIMSAALVFCSLGMNAQFLNRLAGAARTAAENAVQRNVERIVEDGVEKIFNPETGEYEPVEQEETKKSGWTCDACGHEGNQGKFCGECGAKKGGEGESAASWTCSACGHKGNTGKFCDECGAKKGGSGDSQAAATAKEKPQSAQTCWNRYDFVAGDEIIYEDNVIGEQVGELPSKWNLLSGDFEVAKIDGEEVLCLFEGIIEPLMVQQNYLTEKFTLEFDYYDPIRPNDWTNLNVIMNTPDRDDHTYYWNESFNFYIGIGIDENSYQYADGKYAKFFTAKYEKKNDQSFSADAQTIPNYNGWNHFAMSFNNGAVKIYINQDRVINGNMAKQCGWFALQSDGSRENPTFIKNVRLAKGAVPLYDRLATDGKIISYGITFEKGKADIKGESMGEINRIAKLMKDNADLKFEVQGHCDNTGSDKVNDALSQKRAEAIVEALVAQGIDKARLTAVGKGSKSPIADNSTDEGRAKNRRVEFVKK